MTDQTMCWFGNGGGVREDNIAQIERETGATEFHTSARQAVHSQMLYRKTNMPMGGQTVTSEFEIMQTDRARVAACL